MTLDFICLLICQKLKVMLRLGDLPRIDFGDPPKVPKVHGPKVHKAPARAFDYFECFRSQKGE